MFGKQRALTEKALFDYYLISSIREEEIFSQFPFYLDRQDFDTMVEYAAILDKLVRRIIFKLLQNPDTPIFQYGEFPLYKDILGLNIPLMPFFWVRYDGFKRANGGIFFSEFNYDKPCAQREIAICDILEAQNSPNQNFAIKFREGFQNLCKSFYKHKDKLKVAILVDPIHYEEVHLAHLYIDLLGSLNYEFIIAGGDNFYIENDYVFVFNEKVDVILRQYPTEFLHEIPSFKGILELYNKGRVLIINDPRAIIGQTKSLFAFLWEMVETQDSFLTKNEIEVIKASVPYTKIFDKSAIQDLIENKDSYVVKASYGRYSQEVYIGIMHSEEEWKEVVQFVSDSEKLHIIQEFCPIKKERVLRFDNVCYSDTEAFGNFGIYLINGEFAGTCVRWSRDYLSLDETVWCTGIGVREKSLRVESLTNIDRDQKWTEINHEAAFKWGYTDNYTGVVESFVLQGLILENEIYKELKTATESAVKIFKKTTDFVQNNYQLFCPVLGISDSLSSLVTQQLTDCITFMGRLDWVFDTRGNLKLLEFNSETPGGTLEALIINEMVKSKLGVKYHNPNDKLGQMITDAFMQIVSDYSNTIDIKNIGIVSSSFHEDWYNITTIYEYIKQLPFNFILGEVSGLEVKDEKLYLYGNPLDALYRYYPLDWFDTDEYYSGVIDALKHNTLSINPPSTYISQSKAFFALVWKLLENGFYSKTEAKFIEKYIPKTALTPKKLGSRDFCAKPFFGREGEDIVYSYSMSGVRFNKNEFVFQERVDIRPIELDIYATTFNIKEIRFPIIGTYVIGNEFGGIFTRAGDRITNKWIVYLPTYVNNL